MSEPVPTSADTFGQWQVSEAKLSELELGKILRRHRVADLIVEDSIKTGHDHGQPNDKKKDRNFFHGCALIDVAERS